MWERFECAAVGTVTGANSTPSPQSLEPLTACGQVYLWPDADEPGAGHMTAVAARLCELGARPRIIDWPDAPPKGDAADFDGDAAALQQLLADAVAYEPATTGERAMAQRREQWTLPSPVGLSEEEDEMLRRCTDTSNAELFAHFYGDRIRYDRSRGRWLIWDGHHWCPDGEGLVVRLAVQVARWRQQGAAALATQARDEELEPLRHAAEKQAGKIDKFGLSSESKKQIEATLHLAKSLQPIADSGQYWDTAPWLLGVSNGVIDLQTCSLRAGRPEDRLTRWLPHVYAPDADCPRWRRFLQEIFDGDTAVIEYVQRAIGYSLTGDQSESCWWILLGSGSNGKSVFLSALQHVLGPFAWSAPFATFAMQGRRGGGHSEELANLEGRRFVTASEAAEGTHFNETRMKSLTGGDRINASAKYEHERQFDPQLHIWIAVNDLPRVSDDSFAFWRRARVIRFDQRFGFSGACEAGRLVADKNLIAALRAEAIGILAWAVEGCRAWRAEGLTPPPAVIEAVEAYRCDADPVRKFLHVCTVAQPDAFTSSYALYQRYLEWAECEGIPECEYLTAKAFGIELKKRFTDTRKRHHGKRVRGYSSVRIGENVETECG